MQVAARGNRDESRRAPLLYVLIRYAGRDDLLCCQQVFGKQLTRCGNQRQIVYCSNVKNGSRVWCGH